MSDLSPRRGTSRLCCREFIRRALKRLQEAGVESPLLDAQIMMAHALGCSRIDVIAHPERFITDSEQAAFSDMLAQRAVRRPLAYIVGHKEFFGIDFEVSPTVLIPRPETELLVEECVRRLGGDSETATQGGLIADIGTGSGAVAVAIAASLPGAMVYATEISNEAVKVARRNVEKHGLVDRVSVIQGDMLAPLAKLGVKFDAIVSNPPYIPSREIDSLAPEIRLYEPRAALDGGEDGLDAYRGFFHEALGVLAECGFIAVEVGAGQADDVRRIAGSAGYGRTEFICDLAGIERVVVAYL